MTSFQDLNLSKALKNAVDDLGFDTPTPIQEQSHPVILSGANMVGIAQTGTGKTLAYLLPLLQDLKFSKQVNPRILILVPTRELVMQVVDQIEALTTYMTVRTLGIFGGVNINTQIVPGYEMVLTLTPDTSGDQTIICNEYCGIGHHMMTGKIYITEGGS